VTLREHIEHTLLKAEAEPRAIEALCREVLEHRMLGACVNPLYVPLAHSLLGQNARLVSVVGFPLGAGSERSDCAEAEWLLRQGAVELDLVVPVGLACAGQLAAVKGRVARVREVARGAVLKVILETGLFTVEQLRDLAAAVMEAEPDFLKTSTGFGPRGASVQDVGVLTAAAQGRARVKASGGIRTFVQARELLAAGAERIGTSNGVGLLAEERAESSPG
jgi:deoxyribose-phosphate aldolase